MQLKLGSDDASLGNQEAQIVQQSTEITMLRWWEFWLSVLISRQPTLLTTAARMVTFFFVTCSVDILLSDVTAPMYKKTHVFFSSPLTKDMKAHIKDSVGLRLSALREVNLIDISFIFWYTLAHGSTNRIGPTWDQPCPVQFG
ncbi:hypothetical protein GIB67_021527 [Kingdonia uniflora]|uniref:Uncharacterized protein n=1 Tax=Kingdonia uniflora TaxID=39325 RepID=A0A7J7L9J9_9MAGN|nr:hypothetical protein GIB67_021527 [Kingdonia uniflora]